MKVLSKSRFKLGHSCPTKLHYCDKKEYANSMDQNEFMKTLAEGGFQVGELAKVYFPGGKESSERDYQKGFETTKAWLQAECVIYEAAILHQNLYVRVDILIPAGPKKYDLIEVKAKSIDPDDFSFWNRTFKKKRVLSTHWEPYLYDIAFQTLVTRRAFPDIQFTPYLLLADKSARAPIDGMNQLFPILRNAEGRSYSTCSDPNLRFEDFEWILRQINVSEPVEWIIEESKNGENQLGFEAYVDFLAAEFIAGRKISASPTKDCSLCEFQATAHELKEGKKSGFRECWKSAYSLSDSDLDQDLVLDLWGFRQKDKYLRQGIALLKDIPETEIAVEPGVNGVMSSTERRLIQLRKVIHNDSSIEVHQDALRQEMNSWTYPLHFIDFETATVAIPFHKGHPPYGQVAFQFSHHQMEADGSFHHVDQFLNAKPGEFPNFQFARNLKKSLEKDSGTILRYHNHENSVLNQIKDQLAASSEPDKDSLIEFLDSITQTRGQNHVRAGGRNMVDLYQMVIQYYYDPETHGSNSIKDVYPAVLKRSQALQDKYSKPIYGTEQIRSLNLKNQIWVQKNASGEILSPYSSLPPIFRDIDLPSDQRIFANEELKEGGSASAAFIRLQFEEMSDPEREAIRAALLRYCELDTLAMVMIVEHWRELTQ